jgi:hypothetical protein
VTAFIRTLLILITVLTIFRLSFAQTTQPAVPAKQQGAAELRAEIAKLQHDVLTVKADVAAVKKILDDTDVAAMKKGLDETGWKALDFAAQVASAQWTMFGTGLAILALIFTFAGAGAYTILMRRVQFRMNAAATRLQGRLNRNIENEELRLREEMNRRGEAVKEMMESTRIGVQARLYGAMSHVFWEQHSKTIGTTPTEIAEKRRNLETAIYLARLGMDTLNRVKVDGVEDENTLTALQGMYAYYITEFWLFAKEKREFESLLKEEEKREALSLATGVQIKAQRSVNSGADPHAREHLESTCWVFWNLGSESEKQNTKKILREIYEFDESDDEMRNWIRQRYYENKEPTWG